MKITGRRVWSMHGDQCGVRFPHNPHGFVLSVTPGEKNSAEYTYAQCRGRSAMCVNCDDQGCMGCASRTPHDKCAWDCPHCEQGVASKYLPAVLEDLQYESS